MCVNVQMFTEKTIIFSRQKRLLCGEQFMDNLSVGDESGGAMGNWIYEYAVG